MTITRVYVERKPTPHNEGVELFDGRLFSANEATTGCGGAGYLTGSSAMSVRDGAFRDNTALEGSGGALWLGSESSLEITRASNDCRWSGGCHQLTGNTAPNGAGGAIRASGATVRLEGQLVASNSARWGGGVHVSPGEITAIGCVFTANNAYHDFETGDAIRVGPSGRFTGIGVTIAFNDEGGGASGVAIGVGPSDFSRLTLDSSIIWGHGLSIDNASFVSPVVTCSDVEGGYPGEGNLSVDPEFVNPLILDFHLEPGSPLIDRCVGPPGSSADWDWQVRPWVVEEPVTPYDMGADEVGSVSVGVLADGFESGDTSSWS